MFASCSTVHSGPCLGDGCALAKAAGVDRICTRNARKGESEHFGDWRGPLSPLADLNQRRGKLVRAIVVRPALAEVGGLPRAGFLALKSIPAPCRKSR